LDELFDDVRAVPQVLHRRSDIGANRRVTQGMEIVSEFGRQQTFDGRPYQIYDGVQIARLILDRPLQLLQRRFNGAALGVAQHDYQARAELLGGDLSLEQRAETMVARLRRYSPAEDEVSPERLAMRRVVSVGVGIPGARQVRRIISAALRK